MEEMITVDVDDIHSILEATRTVAWILHQVPVDGIQEKRLRYLGIALMHAGEGDLSRTKDAISKAVCDTTHDSRI